MVLALLNSPQLLPSPLGAHLANAMALSSARTYEEAAGPYRELRSTFDAMGVAFPSLPHAGMDRIRGHYVQPAFARMQPIFSNSLRAVLTAGRENGDLLLRAEEEQLVHLPGVPSRYNYHVAFEAPTPLVDMVRAGILSFDTTAHFADAMLGTLDAQITGLKRRMAMESYPAYRRMRWSRKTLDALWKNERAGQLYSGDHPMIFADSHLIRFRRCFPALAALFGLVSMCTGGGNSDLQLLMRNPVQYGGTLLIAFTGFYLLGSIIDLQAVREVAGLSIHGQLKGRERAARRLRQQTRADLAALKRMAAEKGEEQPPVSNAFISS